MKIDFCNLLKNFNPSNFCRGIQNLGIALISQIRSFGGKVVSWIEQCRGTSQKVDEIAQSQLRQTRDANEEPPYLPNNQLIGSREPAESVLPVFNEDGETILPDFESEEAFPLFDFDRAQAETYVDQLKDYMIFRPSQSGGIACSYYDNEQKAYVHTKFEPVARTEGALFTVSLNGETSILTPNQLVVRVESMGWKVFRNEQLQILRSLETWPEVYKDIENREQAEELLKRVAGPTWLIRKSANDVIGQGYVLSKKVLVPIFKEGRDTGISEEVFLHEVLDPQKVFADTLKAILGYDYLLSSKKGHLRNPAIQPVRVPAENAYLVFAPGIIPDAPSFNYGDLSLAHVESIFDRIPVGSWMIRESATSKQQTVTIKLVGGILEHHPVGNKKTADLMSRYGASLLLKKDRPNDHPDVYGVMSREEAEIILDKVERGNWLVALSPNNHQPFVLKKIGDHFIDLPLTSFDFGQLLSDYGAKDLVTSSSPLRPEKVVGVFEAPISFEGRTGYSFGIGFSFNQPAQNGFNQFSDRLKQFYGPEKVRSTGDIVTVLSSQNELIASGICSRKIFKGYFSSYSLLGRQPIQLGAEVTKLLEEGKAYFRNLYPKRVDVENVSPKSTDHQLLEAVYKKHRFLVVGENHNERAPKQFLIDNFPKLKTLEVRTLFLEHLNYDTIQGDLDLYINSPQNDPMPKPLKAYLDYLDSGFGRFCSGNRIPGFLDLVIAAKKNGIRVVAIDTEASYTAGYSSLGGSQGADRMIGMNFQAQKIVEKEGKDGKGVFLVGSSHISFCDGVAGLTEILGAPNIVIGDGLERQLKTIVKQHQASEGFQGRVNLSLTRPC